MLQRYTMAKIPCSNPTPKKPPTGGGEWPIFRTARAQRTVRPQRPVECTPPPPSVRVPPQPPRCTHCTRNTPTLRVHTDHHRLVHMSQAFLPHPLLAPTNPNLARVSCVALPHPTCTTRIPPLHTSCACTTPTYCVYHRHQWERDACGLGAVRVQSGCKMGVVCV